MNPDLLKQQEAFKKTLQAQPVIQRKAAPSTEQPKLLSPSNLPSNSSIDSLSEELRFDDNSIHHVNSYVHAIISLIKPINRPISFDEIKERLNVDVDAVPELLEKIARNERVSIEGRSFSYKHTYDVTNAADLLRVLEENSRISGILVQDLKDSCPNVESIVQEKVALGQILTIRGKDDQPRVLFHNPLRLPNLIDEKFKALWAEQAIPIVEDLEAVLARAGLKSIDVQKQDVKDGGKPKAKASRRFNRRIKITNTHIEGIDFSVDFDHNNKS